MHNLLLAIIFTSFLYLIFKLFSTYKINTFQAIIFNYIIAFFIGYIINPFETKPLEIIHKPWLPGSLFLGFMFICVFNILGKTTQNNGISSASVSSKMAMVIPILFGILVFKENIGFLKISGILIALLAVYFTSKKENEELDNYNLKLPVLLFFGAGIIDTSMNYIQHYYIKESETNMFASFTFIFAFFFGICFYLFNIKKKEKKINIKNIIAGIILGIPNYFSMFYLIKALQSKNIESATIFTLINIGVILFTACFSIFIFKEKLKKENYIGIALAVISVVLVAY